MYAILLVLRYLMGTKGHVDQQLKEQIVTQQKIQAVESNKCSTGKRCDLIAVNVPELLNL